MQSTGYELTVSGDHTRRVTSAWLMLGLVSLIFAGIFSLLLVLARTPLVQGWIPFIDFFHVSLVVHVTLSVLVWLLSISAALWSLSSDRDARNWDRISLLLAGSGTAIIIVSPFAGAGNPLMSNYVPVLQHPLFFAGLCLFAAGVSSHVIRSLLTCRRIGTELTGTASLNAGITLSAAVTAVAILCVVASLYGIPPEVVLAAVSGCRIELTPRLTVVFLIFLALPIIVVPFLYLAHDVTSPGHRLAFTELMKYGGLSCLPLGLAVLAAMVGAGKASVESRYLRSALFASMVLFAAGGVLGFMISGLDIVIPAHYHGATVGVTIAFMGMTYYLLPRLGYGPLPAKMAFVQPLLYGGGQLMHIVGLAWTGGYGVQRKTAGLAQGVDRLGEIAGMGMMGFGGLISVIGGLLFLIAAWKSIRGRKPAT